MNRSSLKYKRKYKEILKHDTRYSVGIFLAVLGLLFVWTGIAALILVIGIILVVIAKNHARDETDWYFEKKRDRRRKQ